MTGELSAPTLEPHIFFRLHAPGNLQHWRKGPLQRHHHHAPPGAPVGHHRLLRPSSPGALSLLSQVADRDRSWTLEQALELAKHYPGRFRPGFGNRVHYSDTNYQILGAILKTTTGLSFEQLLDIRISGPLGLKRTTVFTREQSAKYYELAPVTWKKEVLHAPDALASFRADGAVVANPGDVVTFLRAFWSGRLFDEAWVPKLWAHTRPLYPGISVGTGVLAYSLGRSRAPLVGHSGMTGAYAVVDPRDESLPPDLSTPLEDCGDHCGLSPSCSQKSRFNRALRRLPRKYLPRRILCAAGSYRDAVWQQQARESPSSEAAPWPPLPQAHPRRRSPALPVRAR